MKRLREVPFDRVVQAFLRTEWDYREIPGKDESKRAIVFSPNFDDEDENLERLKMLRSFRAPIVDAIPDDTVWWEVECDEEFFRSLKVIKARDWSFLSGINGSLDRASRCIVDMGRKHIHPMMPVVDTSGRLIEITDLHSHVDRVLRILPGVDEESFDAYLVALKMEASGLSTLLDGNHRAVAIFIKSFVQQNPRPFRAFGMYEGETSQACGWCW